MEQLEVSATCGQLQMRAFGSKTVPGPQDLTTGVPLEHSQNLEHSGCAYGRAYPSFSHAK